MSGLFPFSRVSHPRSPAPGSYIIILYRFRPASCRTVLRKSGHGPHFFMTCTHAEGYKYMDGFILEPVKFATFDSLFGGVRQDANYAQWRILRGTRGWIYNWIIGSASAVTKKWLPTLLIGRGSSAWPARRISRTAGHGRHCYLQTAARVAHA